jgi:hypothetical protein
MKTGQCRVCLKDAELRESHIVPKFIWRDSGLIGANKNYSVACTSDPKRSEFNRQDGFKEHLLCAGCEAKLGSLEAYMKPRLASVILNAETRPHGNFIWKGWDYTKTKLFQMSLLWRMGISSLPIYGMVQLGKHEEIMRRRLLAEDPGEPWRYGCASVLLTHHAKPLPDVFSQPQAILVGKQTCYRFLVAGMLWFVFVSSHRPTRLTIQSFLSPSGDWQMSHAEFQEFEFLRQEIELLRKFTDENGRPIKVKGKRIP